jgi:uncharacterized Zn-finger protein
MNFVCLKCNKEFEIKAGLEQHIKSKNHGYSCTECDKVFINEKGLQQHTEAKHKKWECDQCDRVFMKHLRLIQHQVSKHEMLFCKKCEKVFETKEELNKHTQSKHVPRCEHCKEIVEPKHYQKHLREEHHVCPCGEKFDTRSDLLVHIDRIHNKNQAYTLDEEEEDKINPLDLNDKHPLYHKKKTSYKISKN